jgi:hypothetical protein
MTAKSENDDIFTEKDIENVNNVKCNLNKLLNNYYDDFHNPIQTIDPNYFVFNNPTNHSQDSTDKNTKKDTHTSEINEEQNIKFTDWQSLTDDKKESNECNDENKEKENQDVYSFYSGYFSDLKEGNASPEENEQLEENLHLQEEDLNINSEIKVMSETKEQSKNLEILLNQEKKESSNNNENNLFNLSNDSPENIKREETNLILIGAFASPPNNYINNINVNYTIVNNDNNNSNVFDGENKDNSIIDDNNENFLSKKRIRNNENKNP